MKVLVTGGAGFIGRHLVQKLIDLGHEVIVVDSGFTGNLVKINKAAKLINRDLNDFAFEDLIKLIDKVEIIFHLAAQKHNTKNISPEEMIQTNVNATFSLAKASGIVGINKFVFTSSLYAYGNLGPSVMKESDVPQPKTLYGSTKLMGEHILRSINNEYDLKWNVARLFFIYGPGQFSGSGYKSVIMKNFERLRQDLPPVINGSGSQSLDYVYVSDAVSAIVKLAEINSSENIVNISSGRATTVNDLTKQMQEIARSDTTPVSNSPDWTEGTSRFGDISISKSLLNWNSDVTLREGLSRVWSSLNQEVE